MGERKDCPPLGAGIWDKIENDAAHFQVNIIEYPLVKIDTVSRIEDRSKQA